jgi:hypothetical protein
MGFFVKLLKPLSVFINKSVSLFRLGKSWFSRLISGIIEAGRTISYVETIDPGKSDSLHKAIKQSDSSVIKREFEKVVRFSLKAMRFGKVKVAIDVTEDPYWGNEGSFNTRASSHDMHDESWQYVNLSIVEPYFFPLMSLPYRQIDDLDSLVIDLLEYLRTLKLHVELILFDRGFYHAELIDYLENHRGNRHLPYLIFVPKTDAVKEYIQKTKVLGEFEHTMLYSKSKSKWKPKTKIVVCKGATLNKCGQPVDWCFATNQKASFNLVRIYRTRWNIETGFRIHDEARIKSKSSNPLIRYFYHLIGMILVIMWRITNKLKRYFVFKRYLKIIEQNMVNLIQDPPPIRFSI